MTKRLVEIDDGALSAARKRLRTRTIKDTVNLALRQAAGTEASAIKRALDVLAKVELEDRKHAWR